MASDVEIQDCDVEGLFALYGGYFAFGAYAAAQELIYGDEQAERVARSLFCANQSELPVKLDNVSMTDCATVIGEDVSNVFGSAIDVRGFCERTVLLFNGIVIDGFRGERELLYLKEFGSLKLDLSARRLAPRGRFPGLSAVAVQDASEANFSRLALRDCQSRAAAVRIRNVQRTTFASFDAQHVHSSEAVIKVSNSLHVDASNLNFFNTSVAIKVTDLSDPVYAQQNNIAIRNATFRAVEQAILVDSAFGMGIFSNLSIKESQFGLDLKSRGSIDSKTSSFIRIANVASASTPGTLRVDGVPAAIQISELHASGASKSTCSVTVSSSCSVSLEVRIFFSLV